MTFEWTIDIQVNATYSTRNPTRLDSLSQFSIMMSLCKPSQWTSSDTLNSSNNSRQQQWPVVLDWVTRRHT